MALIRTVSPDQAEGSMKEAYDMFMEYLGVIPKPLQLMSASPAIFDLQLQRIRYYNDHPTLGFPLLAHIRYLVSRDLNYPFCTDFNEYILKRQGLTDEDVEKLSKDPSDSLLEEKDAAMLTFVVKAVKDPSSVSAGEILRLKDMGWEDRDLMDALAHGANMIDHSIMMAVFRMNQECITPP